ncbi:hypothetical protein VU08_03925 [Desulfobulbus sp. F5]|nr:hypothetical protein [Desulfobulbus sp. F5]
MKKVLLGLGAAACVFGFAGSAFAAGQGGIAGSASFQLNGLVPNAVTAASAAVSVGKSTAYAGAATAAGTTSAFSAGTGGATTLTGTNIYISQINGEAAGTLGTAQVNNLAGSSTNIAAPAGTVTQLN